MEYYIASCVFTSQFPQLSFQIQEYIRRRWELPILRCCIPSYKVKEFEDLMPPECREGWAALPDGRKFQPGDRVYSLCHNCSNIIEEIAPGVETVSLWELILRDGSFPFPDWGGMRATVQDCWRARERRGEQEAVRALLKKLNVDFVEGPENFGETEYCGPSLYRPQPARNPVLAPRHYVEGAQGKFQPHTPEEQKRLMEEHCGRYETDKVVCYCHYCLEGLTMGGKEGLHLAQLLFP